MQATFYIRPKTCYIPQSRRSTEEKELKYEKGKEDSRLGNNEHNSSRNTCAFAHCNPTWQISIYVLWSTSWGYYLNHSNPTRNKMDYRRIKTIGYHIALRKKQK